ncbi:MAG TPA: hypothetical protein VIM15_10225 [Gemmatimonadaceae bacterium]
MQLKRGGPVSYIGAGAVAACALRLGTYAPGQHRNDCDDARAAH